MAFWKKLLIVAALSITVFLIQGVVGTTPAQAALYKFNFASDAASGYFIFDDAVRGTVLMRPDLFKNAFNEYDGSVVEYDVSIGKDIVVEKGTRRSDLPKHEQARTIVAFMRPEFLQSLVRVNPTAPKDSPYDDEFVFFVPKTARQSKYELSIRFRYPPGSFSDTLALPKSVPTEALMSAHPYWDFPKTVGKVGFEGKVQTWIDRIS